LIPEPEVVEDVNDKDHDHHDETQQKDADLKVKSELNPLKPYFKKANQHTIDTVATIKAFKKANDHSKDTVVTNEVTQLIEYQKAKKEVAETNQAPVEREQSPKKEVAQTKPAPVELEQSPEKGVINQCDQDPVELAIKQQGSQGFIDLEVKKNLLFNLRGTIGDFKVLEEKRKNLAMRPDFSLSEIFGMIDNGEKGYVDLNALCKFSESGKMSFSREDWAFMLDYFDRDGDSL